MVETLKVSIGDYKTGKSPKKIMTLGLGSCVGITIYDEATKVGGMAHIMLPKNPGKKRSAKFADNAIEDMLDELYKLGLKNRRAIAKVAGGAKMFKFGNGKTKSVGHRNTVMVKKILEEHKIKIVAEDTGGTFGRTITLLLETGDLKVKTIGHGEKLI
ncbi:MAG: chemotaxis protein CheD [Fusobacteriota bacterium]